MAPTETAIWERIFEPPERDFTPEAARWILSLDFPRRDHERMTELAAKSNAGTLTPSEHTEYENYVHVGQLLTLLQAKARLSLKHVAMA